MTRVLHIIGTADLRSGGPIEGARQVGAVWARQGHVQDFATLDDPAADLPEIPGGTIVALGPRARRYGYARRMLPWLRAHAAEYDAVLVSGLWNYSVMAARLALTRERVPYFVYTHGMLDPWFKRAYPLKAAAKQLSWLVNEGPLLHGATDVLFTTEEERTVSHGAFRPYRVTGTVVGYGTADVPAEQPAQHAAFRAQLPALGDAPFLLFLGRVHVKKGCDLLIDGFASVLAAARPELHLVIAGPDDSGLIPKLRQAAARAGIADRLHFPGMLAGDAKWGAFHACEAFALTSHQENFGVAVAEAMACARPVLISDKVNIWREVAGDGAGLVGPDTATGTATLLGRYAALSAAERAAMGAAGRRSFLARYLVDAVADRLMATIEAGIARTRRG